MTYPAISVIISTFNRADLLPRALDSVLTQHDGPPMEVIVVDDASTDTTADVIKAYAAQFDSAGIPFKAFKLAENSGYQAVPKNKGIEFARGDYIRFLDDDNEFAPGSNRILYDAIEGGDIWPDLVYGRRLYVIDPGADVPKGVWEGESTLVEHDPKRLAESASLNYIDTGDFIISRGAFWYLYECSGMFWNETMRRFGDWELVCRAANMEKLFGAASLRFKNVDAVVNIYHWTGKNLQLTRPVHETPRPKSVTTGEVFK